MSPARELTVCTFKWVLSHSVHCLESSASERSVAVGNAVSISTSFSMVSTGAEGTDARWWKGNLAMEEGRRVELVNAGVGACLVLKFEPPPPLTVFVLALVSHHHLSRRRENYSRASLRQTVLLDMPVHTTSAAPAEIAKTAALASRTLKAVSGADRAAALTAVHAALWRSKNAILEANQKDMEAAQKLVDAGKMRQSLAKRLLLSQSKWESMLDGIIDVRNLDDPGTVVCSL
jgi:hypothetical protein